MELPIADRPVASPATPDADAPDAAAPTPPVLAAPPRAWHWPTPPGRGKSFGAQPALPWPQPCRIETQTRLTLYGDLLGFDAARRRLQFRANGSDTDASLAFAALKRVTLTHAMQPLLRDKRSSRTRRPAAAQERDYCLEQVGQEHTAPLTGRTAGHVEAAEGMYLFSPLGEEGALLRVFVPRSAYTRSEFGPSVEEVAARHWIASPAQLLQAVAQPQLPATPLGQALLALGLVTPGQLQRVQQRLDGRTALGEALVGAGLVSRTDLQTALAHKMGYPVVDLERFPLDRLALSMIPRDVATAHRLMPLLRDGERLIVAVDRPGRVLKLRELEAYARLPLVPVLALKSQILQALERLPADAPDTTR
jgi:hypothetical protein